MLEVKDMEGVLYLLPIIWFAHWNSIAGRIRIRKETTGRGPTVEPFTGQDNSKVDVACRPWIKFNNNNNNNNDEKKRKKKRYIKEGNGTRKRRSNSGKIPTTESNTFNARAWFVARNKIKADASRKIMEDLSILKKLWLLTQRDEMKNTIIRNNGGEHDITRSSDIIRKGNRREMVATMNSVSQTNNKMNSVSQTNNKMNSVSQTNNKMNSVSQANNKRSYMAQIPNKQSSVIHTVNNLDVSDEQLSNQLSNIKIFEDFREQIEKDKRDKTREDNNKRRKGKATKEITGKQQWVLETAEKLNQYMDTILDTDKSSSKRWQHSNGEGRKAETNKDSIIDAVLFGKMFAKNNESSEKNQDNGRQTEYINHNGGSEVFHNGRIASRSMEFQRTKSDDFVEQVIDLLLQAYQ